MGNTEDHKLRKEVLKLHHDYDELKVEIDTLLLQNSKKTKPRIIGAFTAAGAMIETLLIWIIKKEGREKQLSILEGKRQGLFEYKRVIQDIIPKQQNIHIGTISQWRNLVAHSNDIDKLDVHELAAVNSALNAFVNWFFNDYLKGEYNNESFEKGLKDNASEQNTYGKNQSTVEPLTTGVITDALPKTTNKKKRTIIRSLIVALIFCLVIFGYAFYLYNSKTIIKVIPHKVIRPMNKEEVYTFLINYFNSFNDTKCNANKFFASKIDHFYSYDSINPTNVDVIRQTNVEYIDNKHAIDKGTLFLYEVKGLVSYWRFWNEFTCYRTSKRKFQSGKVQMEFGINKENKITSIKELVILKPKYSKKKPH